MKPADDTLAAQMRRFCTQIAGDPLLVQGAGGNVSWKEGGTLWIKASGAWLADAGRNEIFVPVDLAALSAALAQGRFDAVPPVIGNSGLRPSIETLLHALMPHRVVIHLHPVEVLAHLVRRDGRATIQARLGDQVRWSYVGYEKPGAPLAALVRAARPPPGECDAIFMESHGLVVGAGSVGLAEDLMLRIVSALASAPRTPAAARPPLRRVSIPGYRPCGDARLDLLARCDEFLARLPREWALYPDHVVFLGEAAVIADRQGRFDAGALARKPPFIFVPHEGVLQAEDATPGQFAQLRCYLGILERQDPAATLAALDGTQVSELLGWDAEKYRQSVAGPKP